MDFENARFDFSEFHPLDHSLMKCQFYPGGRRRHIEYWWAFKMRSEVRRVLLCPLGFHEPRQWRAIDYGRVTKEGMRCLNCFREMP